MIYRSEWWSVELPPQWSGHRDAGCSTFRAEPSLGVLQISAARNETDAVTDEDLREFAEDRIAPGVRLEQAEFGAFSGFTTDYRKGRLFWREWWLRSGHLLAYATYNVDQEYEVVEQDAVAGILSSLASLG